jgi:hypothetical protein
LDDISYPENSYFYGHQDLMIDESMYMNHLNPIIYSTDKVPSDSEDSQSLQLLSTSAESSKIITEGATMETIAISQDNKPSHHRNDRRKLEQREILRKLYKIG